MKILNLKFKNINSLAGEWEIDFTDPCFTGNGLFAITGKTGAGKSSILDAISLALYGKTPRVEITGNNNDVMTRGTSDCYAEITFEAGGKKWKSVWKQERTRTGNLKPVNRQIADGTDQIHADQVRSCDNKIVEILGLTFDQFTKVILLAQGSFAAFLQADKNDKGELLEHITGTEIYGEISKKVYDRNKAEKDKLDIILAELGAIKMLNAEEIENLNVEIVAFEEQKNLLDSDLQTIEKAKKWLADLDILQKQIADSKQNLPDLEQKVEMAKALFEKSETVLESAKTEKEETGKILVKVRETDTKIAEKDKLLNPILLTINELEKEKTNLTQTIDNQQNEWQITLNNLQKIQDWTDKNSKYESLVGRFTAIENQSLQVNSLLNDLNVTVAELEKAKKNLAAGTAVFNNSQAVFTKKNKLLTEKMQELETRKAELSAILAGKELSDYQTEKDRITQSGTNLRDLIALEKALAGNQKEIARCNQIIQASGKAEKEISETAANHKATAQHLEKQIELLDENIKLAKKIQSLEEQRQSLEDGKACPLCGSTEHPFAQGNIPQLGGKELELKELKNRRQELAQALLQDEKTLAKLTSDKNNASANREREDKNRSENNEKRDAVLSEMKTSNPGFSLPDGENSMDFLEKIYKAKQDEYRNISTVISNAENCEKQLKNLRDEEIPQLQNEKQVAEKAKTEAETAQKLAELQVRNQESSATQAKERYETANEELLKAYAGYEVATIENLKKCLTDWNENRKKAEDLNQKIITLKNDITLKNSELANTIKRFDERQTERKNIESERQTLVNQRTGIFGDKKVEDEESRLKTKLSEAENAKTQAEQARNDAGTELAKNQAVIVEREKELAAKQAENITGKLPEELQAEQDEKKKLADEFSQKTGANRQTLIANAQNLEKNSKKLQEKERQQQICAKWGSLNELIGSQDGKKYRNFAQALTFEHLIGLANRQLQKISERYILKRVGDAANPFELSVIDKFQNCDERTAQNLSGGEKFIVSLSLALGLANMASRNMKIDTMFIDEGFGTLDSDYLDTALTALSNLQNEGKLIGVISHLAELKERIAVHIEVSPTGNGHSRIGIEK